MFNLTPQMKCPWFCKLRQLKLACCVADTPCLNMSAYKALSRSVTRYQASSDNPGNDEDRFYGFDHLYIYLMMEVAVVTLTTMTQLTDHFRHCPLLALREIIRL